MPEPGGRPAPTRRQRVAAYALIFRGGDILLTRLAAHLTQEEIWTLPGGGIDFGEHPRDAVVREVMEETGLAVAVGDRAWIDSLHRPPIDGDRPDDIHSIRIVYDGTVPADSPEPRVVKLDDSSSDARWIPVADVVSGDVPVVDLVQDALAARPRAQRQRLSAYALAIRPEPADAGTGTATGTATDEVLLTRISARGHQPGAWTLPGGGVDHGEPPTDALVREFAEETGLDVVVGGLLGVHDQHFTGIAPNGRTEDFHGVHLVYEARVGDAEPQVAEVDGTTDEVAWVRVEEVASGAVEVLEVVRFALDLAGPSQPA